ncbi:hypothetical protein HK101_005773 [Irineochytrium annulatum]|nr:hypothetical protein HK101_005773 [Irineochytrium annulatum]
MLSHIALLLLPLLPLINAQEPILLPCDTAVQPSINSYATSFASHLTGPDGCGNGFNANGPGYSRNLAAMWVRSIFHDAGSWDATNFMFGLDGSIANEIDAGEALGLAAALPLQVSNGSYIAPFSALPPPFIDGATGVQRADLISIAGVTAISHCGGPVIPVSTGLFTARVGEQNNVSLIPADPLMPATQLYDQFKFMGMIKKSQVFALVTGSHSMGGAHSAITPQCTNKTFAAFDDTPTVFDNNIFKLLLADPSNCVLPIDCELARDPDLRPFLVEWAADQSLFFGNYTQAMQQMMTMSLSDFQHTDVPRIKVCPFAVSRHNYARDTAAGNGTSTATTTTAASTTAAFTATSTPTALPTVVFTLGPDSKSYITRTTGTPSASHPLLITYDMRRATCTGDRVITMGAIDSTGAADGAVGTLVQTGGTATMTVQAGAWHKGNVQVWFTCSGGNTVYDSNFGKNWVLALGA